MYSYPVQELLDRKLGLVHLASMLFELLFLDACAVAEWCKERKEDRQAINVFPAFQDLLINTLAAELPANSPALPQKGVCGGQSGQWAGPFMPCNCC